MTELFAALGGLIVGTIVVILLIGRRNRLQLDTALKEERMKLDREKVRLEKDVETQVLEQVSKKKSQIEAELESEKRTLQSANDKLSNREDKLHKLEDKVHAQEEKLGRRESGLEQRETSLDKKLASMEERLDRLDKRDQDLKDREVALEHAIEDHAKKAATLADELTRVAELTKEEARKELMARLDDELSEEQGVLISKRLKDAKDRAKEQAMEIVGRAIQRYAAEHTADTTTAKVQLPEEDLKGRIIGKEGRNIRAFEQATGVDLIIDDTPGIITVSCFDGVRREIARRALEDLLEDGRIQPARIEEVVAKVQQEMDEQTLKLGEDAAYECDVSGLHHHILRLLGKLNFRTSYGQNVLKHTMEVAFLSGALAADLGLDAKMGRRCGLLHDIGKALDHEQEGSHPVLGYEVLKRFGESEIVANAALAHHEGHEVLSLYTTIAAAADAISAARPGARRENLERYIKRLQQLEDIACDFKGVQKAFAIQAGREVRVMVNNHTLGDDALSKVARNIARRIEDEVAYPGEVKVTLIRESRQTATAR